MPHQNRYVYSTPYERTLIKKINPNVEGFHQVWYQGIVKATVSGVFENLKLKISESSDQN